MMKWEWEKCLLLSLKTCSDYNKRRFHEVVLKPSQLTVFFSNFVEDAKCGVVDLSATFKEVMKEKDEFIPSKIYIRECMLSVFQLFKGDLDSINDRRVLVGSSGVGKSTLFFMTPSRSYTTGKSKKRDLSPLLSCTGILQET